MTNNAKAKAISRICEILNENEEAADARKGFGDSISVTSVHRDRLGRVLSVGFRVDESPCYLRDGLVEEYCQSVARILVRKIQEGLEEANNGKDT